MAKIAAATRLLSLPGRLREGCLIPHRGQISARASMDAPQSVQYFPFSITTVPVDRRAGE
jgi:hypothetical protein